MQLTTPELKTYDTVFPGENWFLYWRTSPSLWEGKLREYQGATPIFIPIYWGLHSEHPDQFDFGTYRPETDLKRLTEVVNKSGKNAVFLLPLVPAPFLPNGGIPPYIARNIIISDEGLGNAIVDNEGRLNKLFSYYDPRVFQSFRKFVWKLGQYFSQSGISFEVYGANFGHLEEGLFVSYFNDRSVAFEQGFHRYLKQVEENEPEKYSHLKDDFSYEEQLKSEYADMIKDLYFQSASESIPGNWSGSLKFAFLGGSPSDIFARSSDMWEYHGDFFEPLFSIVVNDIIPVSCLLSSSMRKPILTRVLNDVVSHNYLMSKLDNSMYDEDLQISFRPLNYFELHLKDKDPRNLDLISKGGIKYFFDREFHWMYRINQDDFIFEGEEEDQHKIHYFFGCLMNKERFNEMLKLFLNGGKIFLDSCNLSEELENKLNVFLTENNIAVEKINYLTPILKAQIGEGTLITFDNDRLAESNTMKKVGFWQTMIKYLRLRYLDFQVDDGLYYFWKHRVSNTYELDYEEIRRVSFYNPTSYKKRVHIVSSKNFAYLKSVDEQNVNVKSTPIGIDIDLLPGGAVSLDFGYFEL